MSEDKEALIRYRLKEARESVKEGMSLRSVTNRLYYAMFYAVLAVLQEKKIGTSKHSGAISFFDREFVKTGLFSKEMSKTLHRAFELRQRGDYMEQAEVTREDIDEIFPGTVDFVDQVGRYLFGNK